MTSVQSPQASATIDDVCGLVRERLDADLAGRVERFVRGYYAGVAVDDIEARQVEDLYGGAVAHWRFAENRASGEAKLRVYNPQPDQHGWQSAHTVVEVVTDDMPFLVDSVRMAITRRGSTIHLVIHPVLRVRRDGAGNLVDVLGWAEADEGTQLEAVMKFEIDRQSGAADLEELRADLEQVLTHVRAAVEDWPAMRQRLQDILDEWDAQPPPVDPAEFEEAKAFLRWLADDHFTLLGYREYELVREDGEEALRWGPGPGLGIRRETEIGHRSESFASLPHGVRENAARPDLLVVTKANARAVVHRPGYMDYVGVKRIAADGTVLGERRFIGLYTSAAYNRSPRDIPLLRRKVERVLAGAGYPPRSHAGKALVNILETYPRDVLFQVDEAELREAALEVLYLQERGRIRAFVHLDRFGRFAACIVYVPRDRFRTEVRLRIQEILEETLGGECVDFTVLLSESVLARLHFVVRLEGNRPVALDRPALEERLREVARNWSDDLQAAMLERFGEERGARLFRRYGNAFRSDYREHYPARLAVRDVERMEELGDGRSIAMSVYRPLEAPPDQLHFKLFQEGAPVPLSDALPVLENMGLRAVEERPSKIKREGASRVWMHDFGLTHGEGADLDLDRIQEKFQDTFARVWFGEAESDGFNRLVLRAGLACREIVVLRAYCKFLRQIRSPFSQAYMEQALANNPHVAAELVALFLERFDPAAGGGEAREARLAERRQSIESALDAVVNLDEDRILRAFLGAIMATLRCNYFVRGADGLPLAALSLKFDCARLAELPEPRPLYEIFVYSPRVEGVHLRGARVARGGLRWSDRPEDFRTEVLGLVKAQMVKNAVIVPMGSKGGFVPKRLPGGDRDAIAQEGVACYRIFISGLLDLTDNLVDGQVVPPQDVVRHDDDDPYLVVAADKGTATFSDIANEIATSRGFWLGDAFASGGSAGYDHKRMGITARGAWESVKRHFREQALDTQTQPFTVAGVGDMGGDVFGNGMLLSPQIKLVAAFNHMHIFLDPDPDPAASFAERKRLFELPRSAWQDYDTAVISAGGGVYSRAAKSIRLGPEIAAVLGTQAGAYAPTEVIGAILKAPVDLLWNGGIGTYVKASSERNVDVGDRANDALRVNGDEVRARVIGEGGNLGLTQAGRIEFALRGGRVYTDAIDNSAGVDCSDHEVNIKVLLDAVVRAGDMTPKQRNELLAEMTDEVGELVLRNNYLQTQALSLAGAQSFSMLEVHTRLMRMLERDARLDRDIECLPNAEVLLERRAAERGLVAPELSVLMAYTKINLYQRLTASDLPDDACMVAELSGYFPSALRSRFGNEVAGHQLRREIISTVMSNEIVNRNGTTFVFRMGEETGSDAAAIARAYLVAREVYGLPVLWEAVEALDAQVPATAQVEMLLAIRRLHERATRWVLRQCLPPMDVAATVARFAGPVSTLETHLLEVLPTGSRALIERLRDGWLSVGVPEAVASRVAMLNELYSALDIAAVAERTGQAVEAVAAVYYGLDERMDLAWLRDQIVNLPRENRWQALSRAALRDELYAQRAALTAEVMGIESADPGAAGRIEVWRGARAAAVDRYRQVLSDLTSGPSTDFAMLSVAMGEFRALSRH